MRALAFYLPQYHPTPENDAWWGRGFTEWRNVAKARPRFRGHHQPHVPADLGFYDLRLPETRAAQAELARAHGIAGFCYYHYWFRGRRVLDRPFREVLESGDPAFPFCLCWANEDWTRAWDGRRGERLLVQEYSEQDDRDHIRSVFDAFTDDRYVRVDGKPLFLVYRANRLPDARRTTDVWREEAAAGGVGELYLCRVENKPYDRHDPVTLGFDAAVDFQPDWDNLGRPLQRRAPLRTVRRLYGSKSAYRWNRIFDYGAVVDRMLRRDPVAYKRYPCVTPSWDNTPRRNNGAVVLRDSSPAGYERWLRAVVDGFEPFGPDEDLLFLNAWNEWAEGNHLEPCRRWGHGYLEATRRVLAGAATRS